MVVSPLMVLKFLGLVDWRMEILLLVCQKIRWNLFLAAAMVAKHSPKKVQNAEKKNH